MLNIGPAEVLVIALIALIVVGPEQLPGVLRKIGKSAGQLRHMADGLKKDFMSGMEELDPNTWTEEKPRGKGTTTDPIIGPGAYGAVAGSAVGTSSEVEGKSTRQLADEKAAKDEAAAQDDQPITKPVNQPVTQPTPEPEVAPVTQSETQPTTEPDIAPDETALADQADLVDLDEGDLPQ